MKKILVLNGPNINMLGVREKNIYGQQDYAALCEYIGQEAAALNVEVEVRQSNFEGELVTLIQQPLLIYAEILPWNGYCSNALLSSAKPLLL